MASPRLPRSLRVPQQPSNLPPANEVTPKTDLIIEPAPSTSGRETNAPNVPSTNHAIHPSAASGFHSAVLYDTHRPSYPTTAVTSLLRHLNIDNLLYGKIIDLAAGTGKFTELLSRREEEYEIVAVEPHLEMLRLREKGLENVKTVVGSATNIAGVPDQWADAVTVAQAFHWFAELDALREIHRVLKPAGVLGLIWNVEDYNAPRGWETSTSWESEMRDITWTLDDDTSRFRHNQWRKVFDEQLKTAPTTIQAADPIFSLPIGEEDEKWTVWLTKDDVWKRYRTISHIAVLEGERLEDTRRKVYALMDGDDVEKNERGQIAIHGRTHWAWTTAVPGNSLRQDG